MRTVQLPKSLHELFGKESTLAELAMTFAFSIAGTAALFASARAEWSSLPVWKTALLCLLTLDVLAGFLANLTLSTNNYYRDNPTLRLVFIAVHVQPIFFSLLIGGHFIISLALWIYTVIAAFIVNAAQKHPAQKVLAAGCVTLGLVGLLLNSNGLPLLLLIPLVFYHLKVVYSFSVDQYAPREM
ncbi:MAG: hypothetical protein KA473_02330 [Anaerolineales bacterium]|nr:hypothetical protein [Anaerolineales bacterium]